MLSYCSFRAHISFGMLKVPSERIKHVIMFKGRNDHVGLRFPLATSPCLGLTITMETLAPEIKFVLRSNYLVFMRNQRLAKTSICRCPRL